MKTSTLIVFLASAALAGFYFGRSRDEVSPPPVTQTLVAPTVSIVTALHDVARLEGAVFHIERVIDLKERESRFSGMVQAEDAILLVASGDVTAGVDLSQMAQSDVEANRETGRVRLVLPRAEVLSRRIDNERTYVHTRTTDVLATRKENLETRARQEAERTLELAAIEAGILARAEKNVLRTVEALLRSLGYEEIGISFREDPAGERE